MMPNTAVTAGSWFANPKARDWTCPPAPADAAAFHREVPGYAPTPLVELPALARRWDVRRVVVKDEGCRFGLPAFKALGVSYAIHRVIRRRSGGTGRPVGLDGLRALLAAMPSFELVTATDGNHGRAVARFARLLGIPAHVVVPDVVRATAIDAIRGEGARVTVVPEDYDAAVRHAAREAAAGDAVVLLQDTAWPGYEEIPRWIVDGYSTLFTELDAQLAESGEMGPALVVTPMGVGSLAQATVTHYRGRTAGPAAALLGVEPDTAAGVQASLREGEPVSVPTGATVMAGLNCGTPSSLAWPYLRDGLDATIAVRDDQAADAVRELAAFGVSSGPCGAATLAAVGAVADDPDRRAALGMGPDSTVVLLSTESAHEPTAEGESG